MDSFQINLLVAVFVPFLAALTSYLTYLTHRNGTTIERLERNTNHLLDISNQVAHAAGVTEGITGVKTTQDTVQGGGPVKEERKP